jgi:DnaK suppressor protein
MNTTDIRERLQRRRRELVGRIEHIGSDLRHETVPMEGSFADQATERTNDAVLDAIGLSADMELLQIDTALKRIAQGRYGHCASCGSLIATARLEAVPYAANCPECADQQ